MVMAHCQVKKKIVISMERNDKKKLRNSISLIWLCQTDILTATTPVGEAVQVQEGNPVCPSPCSEGFFSRYTLYKFCEDVSLF